MPYTPTSWQNEPSTSTMLNAALLNKMTDELKSQALVLGITHTLPTWLDGRPPLITDPAPWNEIERVTQAVAVAVGLTYTKTTWQAGWIPPRNAANLNKIEQQLQANRVLVGEGYVEPFPVSAAHRQAIPASPAIHADSATMLSATNNWLLGGGAYNSFREWVGPRPHSFYWKGDVSTLGIVSMFRNYTDGTGYVCGTVGINFPMPAFFDEALLDQGYLLVSPTNNESGDEQLYIVDSVTGNIYQTYRTTPPGTASRDISCSSARWNSVRVDLPSAGYYSGALLGVESPSNSLQYGCAAPFGPSATQIVLGAGMIRAADFLDLTPGSYMNHALRLNSFCNQAAAGSHPRFVAPALAGDGQQANGFPAGCRIQLDPSIDVTNWPSILAKSEPWRSGLMKIARTMQVYGIIPVDSTGGPGAGGIECESAYSAGYSPDSPSVGYKLPWDAAGYGWGYGNGLPYDLMSHFRVIDWNVWTGA